MEFEFKNVKTDIIDGPYEPTWESLKQYHCPDWFRNAKFGVWFHWGPQCVSEYQPGWYARDMYRQGTECYDYHVKNFGHPTEFGYKDMIELWKAEKFDADALVDLYEKMGAKFIISMGVHHDNFDLWDSKYQTWNAVNHGPHRDVVAEIKAAAKKRGLRFGVSEHLERSYSWFAPNKGSDNEGPYKGIPYDGNDPAYRELYLDNHLYDDSCAYPLAPSDAFVQNFYLRTKDLIDRYEPDWVYTDGSIPFGRVGRSMIANFFNGNIQHHDGKLEAVYCSKDLAALHPSLYHGEYVEGVGILDLERTLSPEIREKPWQTDTCLGNWFYDKFVTYKKSQTVLQQLIDVVSKNGTFVLSVPLRADGTLDDKEQAIIAEITQWMDINGEAIFFSRPFTHCGEGPSLQVDSKNPIHDIEFGQNDFRFTCRDNKVYAFGMQHPGCTQLTLSSLGELKDQVKDIRQLGIDRKLTWSFDASSLLHIAGIEVETAVTIPVLELTLK